MLTTKYIIETIKLECPIYFSIMESGLGILMFMSFLGSAASDPIIYQVLQDDAQLSEPEGSEHDLQIPIPVTQAEDHIQNPGEPNYSNRFVSYSFLNLL